MRQYGKYLKSNHSDPDPHAIAKNGVKLIAALNASEAVKLYRDPKYIKVFHVRNPATRLLSAWLSKNRFSNDPTSFAMHHDTFPSFVKNLSSLPDYVLMETDPHIRPLHAFCDYSRGAHYDVIIKFEERALWSPELVSHLQLRPSLPRLTMREVQRMTLGEQWERKHKSAENDSRRTV
eukprot:CAMPEP_0182423824 /NCGR_PEP_ID=MMETSP1167-20130531/9903_1 /TAXON_ID=2988 /ORGANISM="Mallomonas Sp, Strain CCMP3275" /LENGTH=177 /DNA_ID=CAMNT_0024603115 /DNA_START=65 /DNA_END=594 /DNA_ORIENTATION=-